eukprot:1158069-Pelagomonas_calceolata.AAC.3
MNRPLTDGVGILEKHHARNLPAGSILQQHFRSSSHSARQKVPSKGTRNRMQCTYYALKSLASSYETEATMLQPNPQGSHWSSLKHLTMHRLAYTSRLQLLFKPNLARFPQQRGHWLWAGGCCQKMVQRGKYGLRPPLR